ncbi:MAG: hypothetical protein L3K08_04500 [Thermoplasmata archaeon]|nr:hypothetical protein [Thermoplasmata archaeon]
MSRHRREVLSVGTVLVLASLFVGSIPSPSGSSALFGRSAVFTTSALPSVACNPISTPTPSAVLLPMAVPSHNLTAGGNLTGGFEVQIQNFSNTTDIGMKVYVPNLWFKFPLAGGSTFQIHLNASVLTFNQSGWSNASLTQRTVSVPGGLAFAKGGIGTLTSQKLAVMATAWYGQLTLQLRWHWLNTVSPGVVKQGPWSVPTSNSSYPKSLPSIFEPAPYVYITHFNPIAVIGSNYTDNLAGFVGGERFFLEMEYPGTGHVVQDLGQNAPANSTNFTVGIPVLNYVHELSPGTFLVHIHDGCGAMLWNKSVKVVYPPNATIQFTFSPGTCGPITFNSTAHYLNGTSGVFQPSPTAYNFSLSGCKGHSFNGWVTTGGLHIASGHSIVISANGTFTITYR